MKTVYPPFKHNTKILGVLLLSAISMPLSSARADVACTCSGENLIGPVAPFTVEGKDQEEVEKKCASNFTLFGRNAGIWSVSNCKEKEIKE